MDLPALRKWPRYLVALSVALFAGSAFGSTMIDAIDSVVSKMMPLFGQAQNGDLGAIIAIIFLAMLVLILYLVIPSRLDLFNILKP